jgi:hypothetical protein
MNGGHHLLVYSLPREMLQLSDFERLMGLLRLLRDVVL